MLTFDYEQQLWNRGIQHIAGVDEAGRGAWAGPMYAGAVILSQETAGILGGIVKDSKLMTRARRESVYDTIIGCAVSWGVGSVSSYEIDTLGLTRANQLVAERALQQLNQPYDYVMLDGRIKVLYDVPQSSIIDGDALCLSIAAASIIAKVSRDRVMKEFHIQYPQYGFDHHVGYGTKEHQSVLQKYGICPIHRTSYSPIKKLLV